MFRNFIAYHIGLPLFDLIKRSHVRQYYEFLRTTEIWSPERLNEYRIIRLRNLISHAHTYVPFYRKRLNSIGLVPGNIKELNDLKKIPPLTREDLQRHQTELISTKIDVENCYRGSSSGSTGEPVVYYHDKKGFSAGLGALYHGWTLSGWQFGSKILTIWGNPTTVNIDWKKKSSKLKSYFFNETKYPAYQLIAKNNFDDLLGLYQNEDIEFIQGYTNAIYLFAQHIKNKGHTVRKCKSVLTTAENLQTFQRSTIEEFLGPVYDFYGCGEIIGIGFQCKKRDKYHVVDPHVIVEYGKAADDNGGHELLITDLDNRVMPFIRYQNGDVAVPGNESVCECGSPYQTLTKIIGRVSDIIKCPDGGFLTVPSFFGSRLLKELKGFTQYQVELISFDHLIVNIAVNDQFDSNQYNKIVQALNDYIPGSMKWDIHVCDHLAADKNGKYKLIIDKTKG